MNGLPREYHGQCSSCTEQTLVEFSPNILVRHVEKNSQRCTAPLYSTHFTVVLSSVLKKKMHQNPFYCNILCVTVL